MALKVVCLVVVAFACSTASAQVYKCPDKATGRVIYSDSPCLDGKQIVRQMTNEERALSAERAFDSRARFAKEQQNESPPRTQTTRQQSPPTTAAIPPASRHECEVAQKNAWGANKEQAQQKADLLCHGSEKAASLRIARENRAAAEAAERKAARDAERSETVNLTHCAGSFCYDTSGGVYNKTGPDFMTGSSGKTCNRTGATWNCR